MYLDPKVDTTVRRFYSIRHPGHRQVDGGHDACRWVSRCVHRAQPTMFIQRQRLGEVHVLRESSGLEPRKMSGISVTGCKRIYA